MNLFKEFVILLVALILTIVNVSYTTYGIVLAEQKRDKIKVVSPSNHYMFNRDLILKDVPDRIIEKKKIEKRVESVKKEKSIEQLAKETINGDHGTGEEREDRLGSQYEKVQERVNEIMKKTESNDKKSMKVDTTSSKDLYLLAQIIHAETKGEPYDGKIAVGNVIINRVNSDSFPDTIKDVIFQKGQFQPVSNGSIHNKPSSESLEAAEEVLDGERVVGKGVLYFYNPSISTSSWIFSRQTITTIGNHRFAK